MGGLGVVVRSTEMFDYAGGQVYFKTIYWHLKKGSFKVKPGQIVKVGDILAETDNTGFSSGTHLHFGLKPVVPGEMDMVWYNTSQDNGYMGAIDPVPFFNGFHAFDAQTIMQILGTQLSLYQKVLELLKLARYGGKV
jgi:murein DD-endopeptidase MepM/ murein hydrolase activator NlpD